MPKNIIIAGAGVGGLIVGAKLSLKGYDVSLFSIGSADSLGYDWTDSMDVFTLEKIIGKKLPKTDYLYDDIVAFYAPSKRIEISNADGGKRTTTKMERKVFERYLISYAEECGVKFCWNTKVLSPIIEGKQVVGIKTSNGDFYADLVVDACGMDSPIRRNLPGFTHIDNSYGYGEAFYAYRAMYKRNILKEKPICPLEIYLMHDGACGISWYCTRDGEIDILIGRLVPVKKEEVTSVIASFKKDHPELDGTVLRGEGFYKIPVRRTLNKLVADGYAAIGDSAFMTLPMNGSGINFTMYAALILAETIENANGVYTTDNLWQYQYLYTIRYGKDLAGVEMIKNALLGMKPKWVDFLFENRIITQKEMDSESGMKLSFGEILGKAVRGMKNPSALIALVKGLASNGKIIKHQAKLPKVYEENKFLKWNKKEKTLALPVKKNKSLS